MVENTLLSFLLTCLIIELTPGPNMTYIAVVSSLHGRKAGFFVTAGVALGLSVVGIAVSLGLGSLIAANQWLYQALRWSGFLYLLWLAYDGWREHALKPSPTELEQARFFRRGLVTNLLNPKAAVFYIAMLPSFIPEGKDVTRYSLLLTFLYVSIATTVHLGLALAGAQAQKLLQNKRRERLVRQFFSALLIIVAFWFFWDTRV